MTEPQQIVDLPGSRLQTQALTDQRTINSLNLLSQLLDEARRERDEAVGERQALQARIDAIRAVYYSPTAPS